ncbi:MAG TPA: hypothetical protein VFJ28_13355 [Marmoricola sp.]|nr:hypothetical protein [Marmoricola sp.]
MHLVEAAADEARDVDVQRLKLRADPVLGEVSGRSGGARAVPSSAGLT